MGNAAKPPILNLAAAAHISDSSGQHLGYDCAQLAAPLGAQAIGANVTRVKPGHAAWPFHHHYANEEHFFILSGSGMLRLGNDTFAVKPHDYIVNLPGGPEIAHQLINTGDEDLVYLAISTLKYPEVAGYPDAKKTGVRFFPSGDKSGRFLIPDAVRDSVKYWDGEDGARVAEIVRAAKAKA
jgi:uncharacterized cupin superfamily protein